MDDTERELAYLKKQTNTLGAQIIRLKQEHIRANRQAARSQTTALLIRKIYELINADHTGLTLEKQCLDYFFSECPLFHLIVL